MSTDLVVTANNILQNVQKEKDREYVTMRVMNQLLGLPVTSVQDVLNPLPIANVPLAPREIAGSLNLRGRIVTAIDMRERLNLESFPDRSKCMSVVVEYRDELFSFIVDSVGEVMTLPAKLYERNPSNLSSNWQEISAGVYRLKDSLLVIIDVKKLLDHSYQHND